MNGRPRGRPPLEDGTASAALYLTLTVRDYDELYRVAARDRVSMQDIVRRALAAYLRPLPRARGSVVVTRRGGF